jgi:ribosome-associated protein
MDIRKLQRAIVDGLEDVKAQDIVVFNTEHLSPLFERVIIASGTSNRQTKALASSVRETVKKRGMDVLRTEGEDNGEWIIVDCGAAVAHIMQPAIRDYYHLEEIWGGKAVKIKLGDKATGLVKASEPEPAASAPKKAAAKPAGSRRHPPSLLPARPPRAIRRGRGRHAPARAHPQERTRQERGPQDRRAEAGRPHGRRPPRGRQVASPQDGGQGPGGQEGAKAKPAAGPQEPAGPEAMQLLVVAIGQRQPDWADAAWADFAKRFPPEMRLELKALKAEPRAGKPRRPVHGRRGARMEAAIPRGARRVLLDERGSRLTSAQLAERLGFWRGDGRDVALLIGGPDGIDPPLKAGRRDPAPVRPDPAARPGARAAGRGAVPRLVAAPGAPLPPGVTACTCPTSTTSSTWPARARAACSCWTSWAWCTSPAARPQRGRRGAGGRAQRRGAAGYVQRVTLRKLAAARSGLARRRLPPAPILVADTTVALGRRILGKPESPEHAARCRRCRAARTAC